MLTQAINDQSAVTDAALDKITVSTGVTNGVLATPALAFGALSGGWFVGDIIKNVIRGG